MTPAEPSHVRIARVRRADGAELIAANRTARAYHLPWAEPFTDAAGFDAWLAGNLSGANLSLVAREHGTGLLVGVFTLSQIFMGDFRSAYLGYWGYPATGGRGLVTAALRAVVRFAFDEVDLHRIEANVQPGNARSLALVRRAGFAREGFSPRYLRIAGAWRDHERWALLADGEGLSAS